MKKNDYYVECKKDGKKVKVIITAYSMHQINKYFWRPSLELEKIEMATDKDRNKKNVEFIELSEDTPEKTLAEIIEGANEKAAEYRNELHKTIDCTYTRMAECKAREAWELNVVDELQQHSNKAAAIEENYNKAFTEYYKLKELYKELFNKEYKN